MGMLEEATGFASGPFDVTPQIRDLVGRLIIVHPTKYEAKREMSFMDEKTGAKALRDTVWADILVLNAGPFGLQALDTTNRPIDSTWLEFGGDGKAKPATDRIATPSLHREVMIIQSMIVPALKAKMDTPTYSGYSVGVVYMSDQGRQGNPPFIFGPVMTDQWNRERARGAEILAFAEQQVSAWIGGSLTPNTVSDLIVPAPHASPDVHKAYQERLAKRQATNEQGGNPPNPAVYSPPSVAATTPAAPSQYAPGVPAQPVANPTDAVPPGWDAAAWANLDQAMRTMIWGQLKPTH